MGGHRHTEPPPKRLTAPPPRGRAGCFGAAVRSGPWRGLPRGRSRWRVGGLGDLMADVGGDKSFIAIINVAISWRLGDLSQCTLSGDRETEDRRLARSKIFSIAASQRVSTAPHYLQRSALRDA